MTSKIVVTNQKGGAGALAEQDQDVLLVGLDLQGPTTEGRGCTEIHDETQPLLASRLEAFEDIAVHLEAIA